MNKSFRITDGKGFQVRFPNGWVVSIQIGPSNYCDHHEVDIRTRLNEAAMKELVRTGSDTAETAVFHSVTGKWLRPPWDKDRDDVQGWQTPEDVLRLLDWASKLPPIEEPVSKI